MRVMANDAPRFSSRFALLVSVLGIAVGTGNIWRFPRIAAQNSGDNGSGAFLVGWVVCLLSWSIPLIVAEYALGRMGRKGVVGSFVNAAGSAWAPIGTFVAFVATAIMFYYAVVAGWCMYYLAHSVAAPLPANEVEATAVWDSLHGGFWPAILHALAVGICAIAVWKGIKSIQAVNKILIPSLLVIVFVCLVRAVTLPGAGDGVAFLFTPDWATLTHPRTWLEALTQNAWDTGAGWGLILTYAAYMRSKDFIVKNAIATGVCNNVVSLAAATMIFATVFSVLGADRSNAEVLAIMKESGPASTGLTFIWMPQLFAEMPGGVAFVILFFLGLSFAALSSLISMIELVVRNLVDFGMTRNRALIAVIAVGFLLGLPSALNVTFLSNQDFVWGVALMISGICIAGAVIKYGPSRMISQVLDSVPGDLRLGWGWQRTIAVLIPLQGVILLSWWTYLSVTSYAADDWYDPLATYSIASCLVQWGLALGVGIVFGPKMVRWLARQGTASGSAAARPRGD